MANPTHVALLRRSVPEFNRFRAMCPDEVVDLRGAVFHDEELPEIDLHGALLQFSSWRGCDLSKANLERARAFCADLEGATLCGARLHQAGLRHAELAGTNMCGAQGLETADLIGTEYGR